MKTYQILLSFMLILFSALVLTNCATYEAYHKALEHEEEKDLKNAYQKINEAYKEKPNNQYISESRDRIANALALSYLKKESKLPPENLTKRYELLIKAKEINNERNSIVEERLQIVTDQQSEIDKHVEIALSKENKLEAFLILWEIQNYLPYVENVQLLKKYISDNINQITENIEKHKNEASFNKDIIYVYMLEKIYPSENTIIDIKTNLLNEKIKYWLKLSYDIEEISDKYSGTHNAF